MVPVTCKLCSLLGGRETKYWTLDDRKTHAQFHVSQVGYISVDGEQASVKEVFGKCFPLEDFEKSEEIDKSRSTLFAICKRIIADKKNETNSLECQICGSNVRYINVGGQQTSFILSHACAHSTKKPFVCRDCHHESAAKSDMVRHITIGHKIDSPVSGVHFEENWLNCFDEVMESLTKSFVRLNLDPRWRKKNRASPSELSIQRRVIFSKILKDTNTAKKIQCRQCQVEICAIGRTNLEDHIRVHLQKRIHECSMCDESFIHKSNIKRHLARNHGVQPEGNYIDRSDEHHEAIMELLKKCFGKKEGK